MIILTEIKMEILATPTTTSTTQFAVCTTLLISLLKINAVHASQTFKKLS